MSENFLETQSFARFKVSAISRKLFFVEAHISTLDTQSVSGKIVAINKSPSRGLKDVAFPFKVKDVIP